MLWEIYTGNILLYYAKSSRLYKLAKFLINEGINDVIKSGKTTLKGKEISLKEWGI